MTRAASAGDSGGPVYSQATAFGIVTAADANSGGKAIYSKIINVQTDMALTICVTSSC